MHEKQLHTESSFVTLTYDDNHLPEGGTLVKDHCRLFMNRLRERISYQDGKRGLRFYMCGEYGESSARPHYHYLLFNHDFKDKRFHSRTARGEKLYISEFLREVWPFGNNIIGEVTLESCCYVARYITKKVTGDNSEEHYAGRLPEFTNMSRRPGIGSEWYEKFGSHSHSSGDFAVLDGKRVAMPRFYDTRFEAVDAAALEVLKKRRRRKALSHRENNTPERRRVREQVQLARLAQAKRDM